MSTNDHAHDHHITPPMALAVNLVRLAILMVLTVAAAEFDFGHWVGNLIHAGPALGTYINNFVALLIAITKAYFVVMIFMGVKWTSKLAKVWAVTGFVWVTLLLIIFGDYTSRTWENNRGWTPGSSDVTALPSKVDETFVQRQEEWAAKEAEEAAKEGKPAGHE
jgi:caa(3)-type oxidase subunit IV